MKKSHKFLWLLCVIAACFASCHHTSKTASSNEEQAVLSINSSANTSCPYLTSNAMGVPVMSWVQQDSMHKMDMQGMSMEKKKRGGMNMPGMSMSGTGSVYYAIFSDHSKTFGKPMLIPTAMGAEIHGEDAPKILFQKNGHILVVFAVKNPHPGNPYTGAVYYTQSFDNGKTWTTAQHIIKDTSSYDQRYFDMASLPDGKAAIIWLNNSKPQGSTLYFATLDGQRGISEPEIVAQHACQCCRTDILVDSSGKINIAWRDIYRDSIRDMMYACSDNMGKSFSTPVRISADNWVVDGCPHTGPSMAINNEGLNFTWFTMGGGSGVYYCQKTGSEMIFSRRQSVNSLPSSRHPQIVALPNNDLAIVWDGGTPYQNQVNQRIGLQMRGPSGLLLGTRYLTPDSVNADFPVVRVLSNKAALVAYTEGREGMQQVKYRVISLQP